MSESQKKDSLQAEIPKDDKKKEEAKGKAGKDGKKDAKGNKEEELVSCIHRLNTRDSLRRTSNSRRRWSSSTRDSAMPTLLRGCSHWARSRRRSPVPHSR